MKPDDAHVGCSSGSDSVSGSGSLDSFISRHDFLAIPMQAARNYCQLRQLTAGPAAAEASRRSRGARLVTTRGRKKRDAGQAEAAGPVLRASTRDA